MLTKLSRLGVEGGGGTRNSGSISDVLRSAVGARGHVSTLSAECLVDLIRESTRRVSIGLGDTIRAVSGTSGTDSTGSSGFRSTSTVRLAGDGRRLGDVRGLGGVAEAEDRRLPALTLLREISVLGGLGGDAAGQLDLRELRVAQGGGGLDLGVALRGLFLGLLALVRQLLAADIHVAGIDAGLVLGVVLLGELLGLLGFVVHVAGEVVGGDEGLADLLFEDLLESWTDDLEEEGLEGLEEDLVFGLAQLDVHVVDVDGDLVHLHDVLAVFLVGNGGSDLETEALAAKEDVHNTLVRDGREALLLLEIVADISQVGLNTRSRDHELIVALAADLLAAPAEVVVATEFQDIGHEVVALDDQVLNDNIDHGVGNLNTRDGNVAHVLKDTRQDHVANVLQEMLLESHLAL